MRDADEPVRLRSKMGETNGRSPVSGAPNEPQPPKPHQGRNPPHLPTPTETLALLAYPLILLFGAVFAALSPQTRAAPFDTLGQAHIQAAAPSYFARKDNIFNVLFVKRGWFWVTVSFAAFVLSHPILKASPTRQVRAGLRWASVTAWWVLVTQWCFGPPLIDRGFHFTGGKCDMALAKGAAAAGEETLGDEIETIFTAMACRAAGGKWRGGHDISGHVFLLTLGSFFLVQEVGWVVLRGGAWKGRREERAVVMGDGAVKGAGVEAERGVEEDERAVGRRGEGDGMGLGVKFAVWTTGLCLWMLLMTAIYFHTWFEKFTGLVVAFLGIYAVYIVPRWVPPLRNLIGIPGI